VYLYRHGHRVFRSGFMLILCWKFSGLLY
jgi:hypothetical protein